jgi:aerobic carbon-monoxide dehydrogenase small subunit
LPSATGILPKPVREWLVGNLCRCTGYQNIVTSVLRGTAAMHAEKRA